MDKVKNLLSPLASGTINDTLKLVVIGGTMETARRASASAGAAFFLTAHFSQEDYPQPAWGRSREFDITTRTISRNAVTQTTTGDLLDDDEDDEMLVRDHRKRKVAFEPSPETTHTIYYQGHWLRVTRTKRKKDHEHSAELKISVVARNNNILKQLVLEAKRDYEKDASTKFIYMADTTWGLWTWTGARQKRPMSSIVLEPGVKDMLLADCKDSYFYEDWSALDLRGRRFQRTDGGIPFRRGYLLHGVPGRYRQDVLIHSIAGELGLDIYVVSLSAKGMCDNKLAKLMGRVYMLLEDLDAALLVVSRDEKSTGTPALTFPTSSRKRTSTMKRFHPQSEWSPEQFDGVAAAEDGESLLPLLLFATTNHIERLDPALSRPGRMDWQAEEIFKTFPLGGPLKKPKPRRKAPGPVLEEAELSDLAKRFADAIPEDEMSVAAIQGYLLKNKTRPKEAVEEVAEWVVKEREMREKLKRRRKRFVTDICVDVREEEEKERKARRRDYRGQFTLSLGTASTITCADADTEETTASEGGKGEKWVSVSSESSTTRALPHHS
ncbi:P-loop containing nucleoside triphosphate hydrolase protein [Thelephora terrestris]|uniref:P-loop containing nucleoside triphosphate hydrolase protein n=1 Tax=Thelephora terrestris TaxID=56493 RepID=A0A9P6H4E6_9AGAM|nr:P-loop containing nucleoside triphosphate hydrolase protein [Thelephora terrestris]